MEAARIKTKIERLEADLTKTIMARNGRAKRWAGARGGARVMSAEGRERIAAAQRKRWAKFRRNNGK